MRWFDFSAAEPSRAATYGRASRPTLASTNTGSLARQQAEVADLAARLGWTVEEPTR